MSERECDCPEWWHDERDDDFWPCVPPPGSRKCCGRLDVEDNNEIRTCTNERCSAWWCVCGKFTGMSTGPIGCGCEYDRGEVPNEVDDE